ncbi:XRE family transcriptional regulator [Methylobacterium sp. Leaf104]|uniref:helix-turn-helix domain-containing protein n=1 Tax=Methylobacterium TaxID=407 RepID=UPI0006F1CEF8|nr:MULTISPECIES: helix-turn-helix domain-containing protein [Methylobacterium]KQP42372.1 XRE family transcriptional regulator [Methylobacterium sp. Leaf104]MCI9879110.1 helix-turn-helix domain-containing protein [Methylobacterium goesingense]
MDEAMFAELTLSLTQAAAHARGDIAAGCAIHVPQEIDVAAIRKATDLSQDAFARRIGVAVGTLRNWEQRRRQPEGPARVLLALLQRNPRLVEETLGQAT